MSSSHLLFLFSVCVLVGALPSEWTWQSGSSGMTFGNYGTKGIASPFNNPGSRADSFSGIDEEGSFWLFGGWGLAEGDLLGECL